MPDTIENPEQEQSKTLYKVEFWRQNNNWNPKEPPLSLVLTDYVKAFSKKQAMATLKKRALRDARLLGRKQDHYLVSMFTREDITFRISQALEAHEVKELDDLADSREPKLKTNCLNCGEALDDDYCKECGWRRESWFSLSISKQGKTTTGAEQ